MEAIEIPYEFDTNHQFVHFSGGLRAARIDRDHWRMGPVLIDNKACYVGPFTKRQVMNISRKNNFSPIAFEDCGWSDGQYRSSWRPILPERASAIENPSNVWGRMASNASGTRLRAHLEKVKQPSLSDISACYDSFDPEEECARHISLSLRYLDFNVARLAEEYHNQLIRHMRSHALNGNLVSNYSSPVFHASTHSFFLCLGMVRDYLAQLIAVRMKFDPSRIDSMARVLNCLRVGKFPQDTILELLVSLGYVAVSPKNSDRFVMNGWLAEASELRNEAVHSRVSGAKFFERVGFVKEAASDLGMYHYRRPINDKDGSEVDLLESVIRHYMTINRLLIQSAEVSGYNFSETVITDDNVIEWR